MASRGAPHGQLSRCTKPKLATVNRLASPSGMSADTTQIKNLAGDFVFVVPVPGRTNTGF